MLSFQPHNSSSRMYSTNVNTRVYKGNHGAYLKYPKGSLKNKFEMRYGRSIGHNAFVIQITGKKGSAGVVLNNLQYKSTKVDP